MSMFTLYCDDSGTHRESDIAIAGCYIASVEQWRRFQDDWEKANRQEEFGVFHMAEFVAKKKSLSDPAWTDRKRQRTIERLVNIIRTRVQFGIACAVVKSAYDAIVTSDVRKRFPLFAKNHYTFAVRHCIAHVDSWRAKNGYREPMQYVFDRMSKGSGEINSLMGVAVSGGRDAVERYGIFKDGWSFQDKSVVIQLQGGGYLGMGELEVCKRHLLR